nr:probable nucleoside diphosphate kinase 5 isoform X1 [Ziziphus jujuba var. spinosa]
MELFPVWQSKVDLAIEMTIHADAFLTKFLLYFLLVSDYFSCGFASNGSTSGKEKTLAIIKPDGLSGNYTDRIKNLISDSGFTICKERIIQLDEESVMSFYAEHSSRSFFGSLVKYMTRLQQSTFSSGPVLLMILEKENAVADWRALIGPTDASKAKVTHPHSIRALCGLDSEKNCVHGSDSPQSAQREISFFFEEKISGRIVPKHDEL